MSVPYEPNRIEKKWQNRWKREQKWNVTEDASRPKYYVLSMFPYPSGRLHMGHVRNYTIADAVARFRRSEGFNVMQPMGWDAFGLPAENAAIKHNVHPEKWTLENIEVMKERFDALGFAYDWEREVATCLPDYYKWEQLIFTQMFEKGLAYRKASTVNWCPSCNTVLANEQVEDGKCWRCDSEVTTRELEQWFLKITQYAQELLDDLKKLNGWPDRVRAMQEHWIGKSTGAEIDFETDAGKIRVFTTRPDTLYGATYMAVAPEHPLVGKLAKNKAEVERFVDACRKEDKIKRTAEDAPKLGVDTGSHAIHPLTGNKIPIYIANFVLMDYGTGALMAVPAHDARDHAFAKKYNIPIVEVVHSSESGDIQEEPFTLRGKLVKSDKFTGMDSEQAKLAIIQELSTQNKGEAKVNFRMRDWCLSRQRYWGAPIPIIHCSKCGPVPVPKKDLPVVLPKDVEFKGAGESPLAKHPSFMKVDCPKCGDSSARRESDTMDTFMESSWYYLRYCSPKSYDAPFDPKQVAYWMGVDQYIGGIEHAVMHLLYFRFFHKVLRDLGYFSEKFDAIDQAEPVRRLMNHGIVYKDGSKMSKSKGNVVEPDKIIEKFGSDTTRLFILFAAPPEKILEWQDQGPEGSFRFLNRVWRFIASNIEILKTARPYSGSHSELKSKEARKLRSKTHQTIEKIHYDFDHGYHFNTAVSAIMELVNQIYTSGLEKGTEEEKSVLREASDAVVRLLNPFAPHMTEELWEMLGEKEWLTDLKLPDADSDALSVDQITIILQVNGKLRGNLEVPKETLKDDILKQAKTHSNVTKYLEGKDVVKEIFVPGKLVNFVVR